MRVRVDHMILATIFLVVFEFSYSFAGVCCLIFIHSGRKYPDKANMCMCIVLCWSNAGNEGKERERYWEHKNAKRSGWWGKIIKKKITTVKPTYQRVRKKENWREKRETEKRFTRRSDWLMSAYHWYVTCISSLDTDMNSYISIYIHIWAYWLFFLTLSFSLSSRAWLHRIVFVY